MYQRLVRAWVLSAALFQLCGCYAGTRSTVFLVQADKALADARAAGAPESATYAWTMADEYMKKARDEWARSDFESSEHFVELAKKWAAEATSIARAAGPVAPKHDLSDAAPSAPAEESSSEEGVWE